MKSLAMMWSMVALIPLCGLIMAVTPYIMPKNEVFTVTVPASAHGDVRFVSLRRRFVLVVAISTVVCTGVAAGLIPWMVQNDNALLFSLVYLLCTLVPLLVGFALMLKNRERVMTIKQQEGWKAKFQQSVAALGDNGYAEGVSLRWNLLYIPVMVMTAVLTYVLYPAMPDVFPMQVDFSGNVTTWATKSPLSVSFPLFVQAFLAIIMVLCHVGINTSKKALDPQKPAQSGYAYGVFARAQTVMLLIMGVVLCLMIGVLFPLSTVGLIGLQETGLIIVVVCVVLTVAVVAVSVWCGQSGSRVFQDSGSADASDGCMQRDEDCYWKMGIFYVNGEDPSVFVPKRFGVGWTMNFGQVKSWLVIVSLVVIVVGFCVGMALLF